MREILTWMRQVVIQATLWAILCGCAMVYVLGDSQMFLSVASACVIGTAYWISFGYRLFKIKEMTDAQLRRMLHVSFYVRWSVLIGGLSIAGLKSTADFWAFAAGILGMFALMMVNFIRYAYFSNVNKK